MTTREHYKQQRHNERFERALGEKLEEAKEELRQKVLSGEIKGKGGKYINTIGVGVHKNDSVSLFKGDKSVIMQAINGRNKNPLKDQNINKKAKNIVDDYMKRNKDKITESNPMGSKTDWTYIDNCAEFDLVNKGFNKYDSKLNNTETSNMYIYVTDIEGKFKKPCDNCMDMYDGLNYFDGDKFNKIKIQQ